MLYAQPHISPIATSPRPPATTTVKKVQARHNRNAAALIQTCWRTCKTLRDNKEEPKDVAAVRAIYSAARNSVLLAKSKGAFKLSFQQIAGHLNKSCRNVHGAKMALGTMSTAVSEGKMRDLVITTVEDSLAAGADLTEALSLACIPLVQDIMTKDDGDITEIAQTILQVTQQLGRAARLRDALQAEVHALQDLLDNVSSTIVHSADLENSAVGPNLRFQCVENTKFISRLLARDFVVCSENLRLPTSVASSARAPEIEKQASKIDGILLEMEAFQVDLTQSFQTIVTGGFRRNMSQGFDRREQEESVQEEEVDNEEENGDGEVGEEGSEAEDWTHRRTSVCMDALRGWDIAEAIRQSYAVNLVMQEDDVREEEARRAAEEESSSELMTIMKLADEAADRTLAEEVEKKTSEEKYGQLARQETERISAVLVEPNVAAKISDSNDAVTCITALAKQALLPAAISQAVQQATCCDDRGAVDSSSPRINATMPDEQTCVCGNAFMPDSNLCCSCGHKRPLDGDEESAAINNESMALPECDVASLECTANGACDAFLPDGNGKVKIGGQAAAVASTSGDGVDTEGCELGTAEVDSGAHGDGNTRATSLDVGAGRTLFEFAAGRCSSMMGRSTSEEIFGVAGMHSPLEGRSSQSGLRHDSASLRTSTSCIDLKSESSGSVVTRGGFRFSAPLVRALTKSIQGDQAPEQGDLEEVEAFGQFPASASPPEWVANAGVPTKRSTRPSLLKKPIRPARLSKRFRVNRHFMDFPEGPPGVFDNELQSSPSFMTEDFSVPSMQEFAAVPEASIGMDWGDINNDFDQNWQAVSLLRNSGLSGDDADCWMRSDDASYMPGFFGKICPLGDLKESILHVTSLQKDNGMAESTEVYACSSRATPDGFFRNMRHLMPCKQVNRTLPEAEKSVAEAAAWLQNGEGWRSTQDGSSRPAPRSMSTDLQREFASSTNVTPIGWHRVLSGHQTLAHSQSAPQSVFVSYGGVDQLASLASQAPGPKDRSEDSWTLMTIPASASAVASVTHGFSAGVNVSADTCMRILMSEPESLLVSPESASMPSTQMVGHPEFVLDDTALQQEAAATKLQCAHRGWAARKASTNRKASTIEPPKRGAMQRNQRDNQRTAEQTISDAMLESTACALASSRHGRAPNQCPKASVDSSVEAQPSWEAPFSSEAHSSRLGSMNSCFPSASHLHATPPLQAASFADWLAPWETTAASRSPTISGMDRLAQRLPANSPLLLGSPLQRVDRRRSRKAAPGFRDAKAISLVSPVSAIGSSDAISSGSAPLPYGFRSGIGSPCRSRSPSPSLSLRDAPAQSALRSASPQLTPTKPLANSPSDVGRKRCTDAAAARRAARHSFPNAAVGTLAGPVEQLKCLAPTSGVTAPLPQSKGQAIHTPSCLAHPGAAESRHTCVCGDVLVANAKSCRKCDLQSVLQDFSMKDVYVMPDPMPPSKAVAPKHVSRGTGDSDEHVSKAGRVGSSSLPRIIPRRTSHLCVVSTPNNPLARAARRNLPGSGGAQAGPAGQLAKDAGVRAAHACGRRGKLNIHLWDWELEDFEDKSCAVQRKKPVALNLPYLGGTLEIPDVPQMIPSPPPASLLSRRPCIRLNSARAVDIAKLDVKT